MLDTARKRVLADWVVKTKKQVVKLYAVTKWARDAGTVQKCMVRYVFFWSSSFFAGCAFFSFLFDMQLYTVLYVPPVLSTHLNDASSQSHPPLAISNTNPPSPSIKQNITAFLMNQNQQFEDAIHGLKFAKDSLDPARYVPPPVFAGTFLVLLNNWLGVGLD
jgi:Mediator complex subunit MED14